METENNVNVNDILFILKNVDIDDDFKESFALELLDLYIVKEIGMEVKDKKALTYLIVQKKGNFKPLKVNLKIDKNTICLYDGYQNKNNNSEIIYDIFFKPEKQKTLNL